MESKLQVQVQIGDTRRVFLINPPRTYIDLITAILREIPKTKYMEFGLQYENDEGEYVVLNDDPVCLRIAISGSKRIEGTDVSRLKLRIFEGSSPSVKPKDDKDADQPGPSSISSDRSTARTCLDKDFQGFDSNEEDSDSNNSDYDITCNTNKLAEERTPTERYIIKSEEKIEQKRSVIHSLREKLQETESKLKRVKSDPRDGNVCRNCHLRLGHTSRSCDYGKCSSVFKCGMEKFHPGEHNVKDIRSQLKKHERELEKLIEELKCKKTAVSAAKDKVQVRIESDLFQANKATYTVNGIKNWSLLRKHVYLVQEYCKKNMNGKIPAKQDMEMILDKALLESNCPSVTNTYHRSKQTGSRKRGNPAKDSLERLDIEFPISKRTGCSFTSDAHDEDPQSQILNTAPRDEGEEAEQLAIVMRESVRHTNSKETLTPNQSPAFPFSYAPRFPVFPPAVDYNPIAIQHDPIMPTMPMNNQPYHSASIENFPTTYPQSLGHFPAYPANVGPFHLYPRTEYGVLPMNYVHGSNGLNCYSTQTQLEQMTESEGKEKDKAVVEKCQDIEVLNSDDSYAAASLLMNMATHHTVTDN